MNSTLPSTSSRLTLADYFARAIRILSEGSHEDLTIAAMCDSLEVSKGSFYHHFGSWQGFVKAFLENWERETTLNITEISARIKDPKQRHRIVHGLIHRLPHDAEGAIRVWARTDPLVRTVQMRVDEERIGLMNDAFGMVLPPADARQLAELHHLVLVSCQMLERPVSTKRMLNIVKVLTELEVSKYGPKLFGD